MSQEGFIFYRSFYKAIQKLNNDDFANAVRGICAYALDGEEIELEGTPQIIFDMAKPQIDANIRRREGGKKGGRPKKEKTYGFENEKPMVSESQNLSFETGKPKEKDKKERIKNKYKGKGNQSNQNQNQKPTSKLTEKEVAAIIPDFEEVEEFAAKINRAHKKEVINAEEFYKYYMLKDWQIEGEIIRNWKGLMIQWKSNIESYGIPVSEVP